MKIIANRLNKKILDTIIGNHQSGFCANRNILDAFLEYNMILENPNNIPTPSWLVFLDQKKAYDRVNHTYLFQTLSSFGFSTHFCTLIRSMYENQIATISDKGIISESFSLERDSIVHFQCSRYIWRTWTFWDIVQCSRPSYVRDM